MARQGTAKELDEETGLYYYGARYLDPKYSMWISTDPALGEYIPQAPINDEAKKNNQNLPGMGGIFNHINSNLYHYAGNNPVKYTDPDGRELYVDTGDDSFLTKVEYDLKQICPSVTVDSETGKVTIDDSVNVDGHEKGAELIIGLVNSDKKHIIRKTTEGNSAEPNSDSFSVGTPCGSYVNFNPEKLTGGKDSTGSKERPSYVGLSHELGHSESFDNGTQVFDLGLGISGTTPPAEENSLKRENDVREENGLYLRPYYYND